MAATDTIFDEHFKPVGEGSLDDRKRISLAKVLDAIHAILNQPVEDLHFKMYVNDTGQILLTPQTSIPAYEVWLYKNKTAMGRVARGLRQSARGKVKERGSFARYANDKIDD